LGKRLHAEGLIKHATIPEMKKPEREHETRLGLIRTIIDLKYAGKVKEAEIEFATAEAVSNRIIELLTAIESNVNRKTA